MFLHLVAPCPLPRALKCTKGIGGGRGKSDGWLWAPVSFAPVARASCEMPVCRVVCLVRRAVVHTSSQAFSSSRSRPRTPSFVHLPSLSPSPSTLPGQFPPNSVLSSRRAAPYSHILRAPLQAGGRALLSCPVATASPVRPQPKRLIAGLQGIPPPPSRPLGCSGLSPGHQIFATRRSLAARLGRT